MTTSEPRTRLLRARGEGETRVTVVELFFDLVNYLV